MPVIVQKYGGSSLADAECIKRVASRISACKETGNDVVVVVSAMGETTDLLIDLACQISDAPEPREMDLLLSTGELVSCTLVTMAIRSLGYPAISLSGAQAGIRTDASHNKAKIVALDPERIQNELAQGRIVVVAGFQGVTAEMDVTTLGRGGSDTTAVALTAALDGERCEIYTDVEGIYTADPRYVSNARKLKEIGYDEMLELASYGAKMHPRSIELGAVYNIPILVVSSFTEGTGTLIHREAGMEEQNKVRGVAVDKNVAKITLRGIPDKPGIAAKLFDPLAKQGVSVDTIVQNASVERATDLTFTVARTDLKQALEIVELVSEEVGGQGIVSSESLAKVSVVGTGMQNSPGYAATMFRTLYEAGINIELITTSEIRITCIVDEDKVPSALQALHKAFLLDEE
ncbi:MAG: aspartate kinase [SAR202 cluster bacterium Io17-Chloro-G3]|nr:MAG: aspartate kinase [SAR202 cluster bacterium Io17-Chloro-G3]